VRRGDGTTHRAGRHAHRHHRLTVERERPVSRVHSLIDTPHNNSMSTACCINHPYHRCGATHARRREIDPHDAGEVGLADFVKEASLGPAVGELATPRGAGWL